MYSRYSVLWAEIEVLYAQGSKKYEEKWESQPSTEIYYVREVIRESA